jgi:hypothetical protein
MSEKGGILRMMASGRWAVCRAGREPAEITGGELFRVEFKGELQLTRMEYQHRVTVKKRSQCTLATTPSPVICRATVCGPRSASVGKSSGADQNAASHGGKRIISRCRVDPSCVLPAMVQHPLCFACPGTETVFGQSAKRRH